MKNTPIPFLLSLLLSFTAFGQKDPEVDNMLTQISRNLLEADYLSAIASYDVLIAKDPKNESEYYYEKGICYYRLHLDSTSKESFRLGLTKNNVYAGNNLGAGLYRMNAKPDSALIYFRKASSSLKDSLSYLQNVHSKNYIGGRQILSDVYHNMGLIFLQKELYDSAQHYLFKSMDLNPSTDEHFLATSYFFYKNTNYEKAYSYAKVATDLNRYESRSAVLLTLALEKQGKLTKAIASLKELIIAQEIVLNSWKKTDGSLKKELMSSAQIKGYKQMLQINAEFYVVLAYLHYQKGEREFSADAYKRAVRLSPEMFSNIANDTSLKTFIDDFILYKLRPPVAPKNDLPVYRNLISTPGSASNGVKP